MDISEVDGGDFVENGRGHLTKDLSNVIGAP